MSSLRIPGLLLIFAVSFAAVSWTAGALDPAPSFIRPKLEYLDEHGEEIDLVFVGSSRLYRGVIPAVFDAELARRGHRLRSFNLSMVAMRPHEANAVLRRMLDMHPGRLRYVVIELADWTPVIMPSNRFSERATGWHDTPETRSVLRSSWLAGSSLAERLSLMWNHLLHWGAHVLHVGRGPAVVGSLLGADAHAGAHADARADRAALRARRGFAPFTAAEYRQGLTGHNRRQLVDDLAGYRAEVARIAAGNRGPGGGPAYNVSSLERQVRLVEEAGAVPIYVVPPGIEATPQLLRQGSRVPVLLAFNDPERYPELYRVDRRFDRRHLNTAGARAFSTELARRVSDWLAGL